MDHWVETEDQFSLALFKKRGISIARGKGACVWDSTGRKYIDCHAGQGVVNIGHCNSEVVRAVSDQAARLISCTGSFYNDTRARLLQKLDAITPAHLKHTFLCNSGTEAIEAAIKFARYSTGRNGIVCAMRAFHGRTMGALSATFNPAYKNQFEPLVPGFSHTPFNNSERLEEVVDESTAAVLLEVVQGEGGVNVGQAEFFETARRLCDNTGALLIIDEVQTGFGRTGKMFAIEHFGIRPDILCLAKAIAGGLPMGAVLCSDKIKMDYGKHGSTFGGNPLACAAAIASIDFMLSNDLPGQAREKGLYFRDKFLSRDYARVRELRLLGLMIGIELKEKSGPCIQQLQELGVLALPAGMTVLRLLPPLVITREELDFVLEKLDDVLRA